MVFYAMWPGALGPWIALYKFYMKGFIFAILEALPFKSGEVVHAIVKFEV
jgi:hypothetical protein